MYSQVQVSRGRTSGLDPLYNVSYRIQPDLMSSPLLLSVTLLTPRSQSQPFSLLSALFFTPFSSLRRTRRTVTATPLSYPNPPAPTFRHSKVLPKGRKYPTQVLGALGVHSS